uniref:SLOG family protein n=3 Tax=Thiolapillus sp. TaxID=2017437 RepID=UPI003AF7C0AA
MPNSFSVAITPSNEARGLREGTWRLPLIGRDSRCIALSAVARPVSELFTYARQHPDKRFVLDEMSTATHSITAKHYADFFRQRPANVSVPTSWDESHPPLAHSHRLVVAGSRDYDRKDTLFERLDHLTQNLPRQELLLIEGGASGADALGSEWAEDRSIARASFPAFWKDLDSPRAIVKIGRYGAYNARAGMDRNARMAACTTLLAAFPSRPDISSGTKDMIAQATALGLAYRVVMPTTSESFATDNTYGEH